MLRLHQHKNAAAAKNYYRESVALVLGDYYRPEVDRDVNDPVVGLSQGRLASQLGLSAEMTEANFHDIVDGFHPQTGEPLNRRHNFAGNRRVGVDLTFDVGGKSISAYYARTRDQRVLDLFNEAVEETMRQEVEPRMMVRVRQDGNNHSKRTQSALWTSIPDLWTRPTRAKNEATGKLELTGTVDPHIHNHVYLLPYTYDPEYQNWDGSHGAILAADNSLIWANAAYLEQNFKARYFKKLKDAGFQVVRTPSGIDLHGWTPELDQTFSRRKLEIEAWAQEKGITRIEDKAKGGLATRNRKHHLTLSKEEQFAEWNDRLSDATWNTFVQAATTTAKEHAEAVSLDEVLDYGLAHRLERDNSATIEEVMWGALDRGMGDVDVDALQRRLMDRPDVVAAKIDNQTFVTTCELVRKEAALCEWAVRGQGTCLPLGSPEFAFQPLDLGEGQTALLNANQQASVRQLLASTSRVNTLRGAPGVGKTTAISQLFRGVEENGGHVLALASTSSARDVLRKDGVQTQTTALVQAETLAKFLTDIQLQEQVHDRTLIVLDESTLAGLDDIYTLARVVEERNARLLLVGDFRQLDAVQRHGKIFEQLSNRLATAPEITEIVRQRDQELRKAATLSSSGDPKQVQEGFDKLVQLGSVRVFDEASDRTDQAAQLYVDITGEKRHKRGQKLAWTEEQKSNPAMYRSGQTVVVGSGKQSQRWEVVGRDNGRVMVIPAHEKAAVAVPLDLSRSCEIQVYSAHYQDAMLVVGTHKEGERLTKKIRALRQDAGELGAEGSFERLENLGLSRAEKSNPAKYTNGMLVEFARKAKTQSITGADRTIGYGERFLIDGTDEHGQPLLRAADGDQLVLPLALADRFDVYRQRLENFSVGDRIRMTKNGRTMSVAGRAGVRFSNNDTFEIKGLDKSGNPIIGNDHVLPRNWGHFRSGYYHTAMSSQGSTASHVIFVDSREAGRARSMENYLVAVTRGKHAATLITDDLASCRNHAIIRSSQRPSAAEILRLSEERKEPNVDTPKQSHVLQRFATYARETGQAIHTALQQAQQRLTERLTRHREEPKRSPA